MEFTKRYPASKPNFYLLPDIMAEVESSVPSTMLYSGQDQLRLDQYFNLKTSSQEATTRDPEEFKEILRTLNEPVLALDAEVDCFFKAKHLSDIECRPSAFEFQYRPSSLKVVLARNTADNIKQLFSAIEEAFSLEAIKPEISEEGTIRRRTAFLAHSFDQIGKSYAYELIKFLGLVQFEVSTGEGFSPERISKKVKQRLTSQEVVIVIVSKKDDITWLIQEATGAAFAEKPLILLIEKGVEFKPGILGDLEYIEFSQGHISATFIPILEGLQELGYRFG